MNFPLLFWVIFLIFISLFMLRKIKYNKSKTAKTKYQSYQTIGVFAIILCLISFVICMSLYLHSSSEISNNSVADGFVINSMSLNIEVDENNVASVTQNVDVNFYESGHHGIYITIPKWLKYTNKDGETLSKKSKISNLKAIGENYTIENVDGKKRIKIGDANTYIRGNHQYQITYDYDMGGDPYDGYDEFIFHAFGDYWGTPINNASIIIKFPNEINAKDIRFFADKYRKQDITKYINYELDGNILIASVSSEYDLNSALTIDIVLPDGFFKGTNTTYGYISMICCLFSIVYLFVVFISWIKYGKNLRKEPKTVEFYSPDGLDASEIGYIYKGETGKKLTIALIIELAGKKYINIEEKEDKTIILSKVYQTDINSMINRTIILKSLAECDKKSEYYKEYKKFIKKYPMEDGKCEIKDNFDTFIKDYKPLVASKLFSYEDSKDKYDQSELSKTIDSNLTKEKEILEKMTKNEKYIYEKLFENDSVVDLKEHKTFHTVFNNIGSKVENKYKGVIKDVESEKTRAKISCGLLLCFAFWILGYSIVEDLNPKLDVLYSLSILVNIINLLFVFVMGRSTVFYEKLKARIRGFREYIKVAEKSQIELLINENPNYFFDIIPYAYVLGVTNAWIKKFEDIDIPGLDTESFNYLDIKSFDSIGDSVYYPSSSSGSGSSSSGGGCSSCGGGCSSCGGGGSW